MHHFPLVDDVPRSVCDKGENLLLTYCVAQGHLLNECHGVVADSDGGVLPYVFRCDAAVVGTSCCHCCGNENKSDLYQPSAVIFCCMVFHGRLEFVKLDVVAKVVRQHLIGMSFYPLLKPCVNN